MRSLILACVAVILCGAGLLRLKSLRIARAIALIIAVGVAIIAVGVAILQRAYLKYDYGLYKVFLLSSLVWLPVMFVGIDGIGSRLETHKQFLVAVVSCLLLQSIVLFQRFENRDVIPS